MRCNCLHSFEPNLEGGMHAKVVLWNVWMQIRFQTQWPGTVGIARQKKRCSYEHNCSLAWNELQRNLQEYGLLMHTKGKTKYRIEGGEGQGEHEPTAPAILASSGTWATWSRCRCKRNANTASSLPRVVGDAVWPCVLDSIGTSAATALLNPFIHVF